MTNFYYSIKKAFCRIPFFKALGRRQDTNLNFFFRFLKVVLPACLVLTIDLFSFLEHRFRFYGSVARPLNGIIQRCLQHVLSASSRIFFFIKSSCQIVPVYTESNIELRFSTFKRQDQIQCGKVCVYWKGSYVSLFSKGIFCYGWTKTWLYFHLPSFHYTQWYFVFCNQSIAEYFIKVTNFSPNPSGNLSILFEIILHIFSIIAGFKSNFIPLKYSKPFTLRNGSLMLVDVFYYLLFRFPFLAAWISDSSNNQPNLATTAAPFWFSRRPKWRKTWWFSLYSCCVT